MIKHIDRLMNISSFYYFLLLVVYVQSAYSSSQCNIGRNCYSLLSCTKVFGFNLEGCCSCKTVADCKDTDPTRSACRKKYPECASGRCVCRKPHEWKDGECYCPSRFEDGCICPDGNYLDVDLSSCIPCGPGTRVEDDSSCEECPENSFSDGPANALCTECELGTYNYGNGNTKCCPIGYYQSLEKECIKCEEGTGVFPDKPNQCTECEPGYFSNSETNFVCTPCSINSFSKISKSSICDDCEEGTFQPLIGQTECNKCHKFCTNCDTAEDYCSGCIEHPGIKHIDNKCICNKDAGYFEYVADGELYCGECQGFCKTCKDSPTNCESCLDMPGIIFISNECLCAEDGYFLREEKCLPCHPLCSSCFGISYTECNLCDSTKNAILTAAYTCECFPHFYYDSSVGVCKACNKLCDNCFGPSAFECEGCINSFPVVNLPWCVADCTSLLGYYEAEGWCACNLCYI